MMLVRQRPEPPQGWWEAVAAPPGLSPSAVKIRIWRNTSGMARPRAVEASARRCAAQRGSRGSASIAPMSWTFAPDPAGVLSP
jgi:hypothetical protein